MEGCRAAEPSDLEIIASFARALRDEVGVVRGGPVWAMREGRAEPLLGAYAELLERDDARVVVGTIDDVVVGFAVGELARLHDGAPLGVISDLYVEPEAREIGVGEAMANGLLEWFHAEGCLGVDALALPGHRMTKNFFEDHGFVSRLIVVHRDLRRDPPDPEPL